MTTAGMSLNMVVFLVVLALAFDFMNGFHDAANSIATVVSTRVLRPHFAVAWAAFFNFIAFLFFGLNVANTIGTGVIDPTLVDVNVIIGALTGAIAWNVITWWYGLPAMLKGWIERVFLSGPIYGGKRVYGRGGLAGKHALVAFSLGGRPHMFGPGALHGELETGMLRHFLQGTLGYAGLTVHRPFVAYHVPYVGDDDRRAMLDELRDYVRNWRAQEVMPMPDLDNYDATFAPRGEATP